MRKTKPPVGWEHVKNCFPVPNILLDMDLPASAVAVYLYLLRSADRKTDQCHPSEATIAKRLHLSRNTVAKYVRLLEERGLIITEHTKIITKNGIKKNGNLLYTLVSMHEITQASSMTLRTLLSPNPVARWRSRRCAPCSRPVPIAERTTRCRLFLYSCG